MDLENPKIQLDFYTEFVSLALATKESLYSRQAARYICLTVRPIDYNSFLGNLAGCCVYNLNEVGMKPEEWKAFVAEGIGTSLLVFGGISVVIINFGAGSSVASWIPDAMTRRLMTGFLFGSVGCLITLSPLGRISGAHLNPAVTIAFFGRGLLPWRALVGYITAQLVGSTLGAGALYLWGPMGDSLHEGITVPGPSVGAAFAGEAFSTFCLISVILLFTGHDRLKAYTPFMIPPLFSVLVGLEAPLSGCSANPARSFGPAVWSGIWTDHWLYWLAPITGVFGALLIFTLPQLQWLRTDIAKLYHFRQDRTGFLQGQD